MYMYTSVGNFTTNLAECWMSIRAKFDGGKQYNRSQSGAWEGRCAGAGLRQNLSPAWGTVAWERATGTEANPVFMTHAKNYTKEVERDRKRKASDEVKQRRLAIKYRKSNDNSLQARCDYARHDNGPSVHEVNQDVPANYLQGLMMDYYKANVLVSPAKVLEIEAATRSQGSADELASNLWMAERRKRITSSVCGQIAKRRSTTKVANLVKTLLYTSFKGNDATKWGISQEQDTQRAYQNRSPAIAVRNSGLTIHSSHHWFGASPDGLVYDPKADDPEGIVEYKNPYAVRAMSLRDAAHRKDFCLALTDDGSLSLKRTHNYYYQVQATMSCTGRKWCDLVIRTTVDLHVERVMFDPEFWKSVMCRLHSFYFSAILPELAVPSLQKGGIREPSEWLHDPDSWKRQTDIW